MPLGWESPDRGCLVISSKDALGVQLACLGVHKVLLSGLYECGAYVAGSCFPQLATACEEAEPLERLELCNEERNGGIRS